MLLLTLLVSPKLQIAKQGIETNLFVLSLIDVPCEDLELLPLFARMLTQTGTSELSSVELSRKIGTETGGIGSSYHSSIR